MAGPHLPRWHHWKWILENKKAVLWSAVVFFHFLIFKAHGKDNLMFKLVKNYLEKSIFFGFRYFKWGPLKYLPKYQELPGRDGRIDATGAQDENCTQELWPWLPSAQEGTESRKSRKLHTKKQMRRRCNPSQHQRWNLSSSETPGGPSLPPFSCGRIISSWGIQSEATAIFYYDAIIFFPFFLLREQKGTSTLFSVKTIW